MSMYYQRLAFPVLTCVILTFVTWLSAQQPAGQKEVQLNFNNDLTKPVDIYFIAPDETESDKPVAGSLPPGKTVVLPAYPGNLFQVRIGDDIVGEYQAVNGATQNIDLAELASWQLPVTVVFDNDSDAAVDLFLRNEEGEEQSVTKALGRKRQFTQDGVMPGTVWCVRRDSKIVAEYIADNDPNQVIPLKELIEDYALMVTVTFRNTLSSEVDVYWRNVDGSEDLFMPGISPGKQFSQRTFPNHIWIIRRVRDGNQIAAYVAGTASKQICDIKETVELIKKTEAAAPATTPTSPK